MRELHQTVLDGSQNGSTESVGTAQPSEVLKNPLLRAEMIQERAYQINIALEAVKRNTLVVLPTALGKTVIAAMAAAHFIYNHRGRKVLVMAPTRPLVLQHHDTFTRLLKLKREDVEILTGRFPPNYRTNVWNGPARLYFATPQVVHNDSDRGLSLKDFSLLVFDECHRARKNYSYTKVAQAYVRDAPYPMILGMTASPGAEREKIEEICRALFIEHVETRTEDDGDVKPYVSPVAVEWKFMELPDSYGPVREAIKKALERRLTSLASMGVIRKHPRYIFRRDLVAVGDELIRRLKAGPRNRGMLFGALGMQSSALTLYHALELLESQGPHTFRDFLERVRKSEKRSHKGVVKDLESEGVFGVLESLEDHPKMCMLEELVLGQLSDKKAKIMVFTQYRATAAAIVSRFLEMGVSARKFVGQADREDEAGMSQEEQATALERFRDGRFNVLVATSIGEEGLDIPNVDLVLFYEPVPSEIRYIQRKGRTGRGSFGKVVILAAEGTLDASYLKSSKRMAERMKVVMKKLNSELGPVLRVGQPPEVDRMLLGDVSTEGPPEPIADAEEEFEVVRMRQREFGRETRKVAEELLEKTLKCGRKGLSLEEIDERGMSGTVKEAVDRLVAEEQVKVVGGRLLPHGVAEPSSHGSHVFEVEKVMRGEAILLVDDKWRAVLTPEAYNGPRQLLKKGSRFSAASELYRQDGVLHAKIWAVEKTFS